MIEEELHFQGHTKGSEHSQHVSASLFAFHFDYLLAVEESNNVPHLPSDFPLTAAELWFKVSSAFGQY